MLRLPPSRTFIVIHCQRLHHRTRRTKMFRYEKEFLLKLSRKYDHVFRLRSFIDRVTYRIHVFVFTSRAEKRNNCVGFLCDRTNARKYRGIYRSFPLNEMRNVTHSPWNRNQRADNTNTHFTNNNKRSNYP